jgi:hypothetical protein
LRTISAQRFLYSQLYSQYFLLLQKYRTPYLE